LLSTDTVTGRLSDRSIPSWAAALAVLVGVGLLYAINAGGRLPDHDELYHILAARGVLATGEPRIDEGVYNRVLLHTWLVARSFALLGEGLAAARLPSLVPMAGLATLLFVWLDKVADRRAAWLGTLLFAVSPFAVDLALYVRFYALQGLAFFVGAILLYAVVTGTGPPGRRVVTALAAGAALLLACYLQPTSLLGLAGLGIWAFGSLLLPWLATSRLPSAHKLTLLATLAALGAAALLLLSTSGRLGTLWEEFRSTPLFNQASKDQFWYYHAWYSLFYPTLWPVTALLSLVAVVGRPRPAGFALVVFAVAFLLNSIAAAKGLRYIWYAQPFLFVLWGIGLAELWPRLARSLRGLVDGLGHVLSGWLPRSREVARLLATGAVLFLVLANPAWLRSVSLLASFTIPPELPDTLWPMARPALAPWVDRVDVVVTTNELALLYYFDRPKAVVSMSPSKLLEIEGPSRPEFSRDPRTGRPVIATREALARLMACYPIGLLVGDARHWAKPTSMGRGSDELVLERMRRLDLPPRSEVFAYAWERPVAVPRPADCIELDALGLGRAGPS
jgi:hypothetical protein